MTERVSRVEVERTEFGGAGGNLGGVEMCCILMEVVVTGFIHLLKLTELHA